MNYCERSLEYLCELVKRPSVTPHDAGCLDYIADVLRPWGFDCVRYDHQGVSNLWAICKNRAGSSSSEPGPLLIFAGHTDVVPPGPLSAWDRNPFEPWIEEGIIHGRGVVDMKGGIAAMLSAVGSFLQEKSSGLQIAFLLTSDEEGPAVHGSRWVVEQLKAQGIQAAYCLVGEPSSEFRIGDVIKPGRRGSLNGILRVVGQQGHIAYPERSHNPIHQLQQMLGSLLNQEWDPVDCPDFPKTQLQISNLKAGCGVTNVIPGEAMAWFNLRFSPQHSLESLQARIADLFAQFPPDQYELQWQVGAEPFYCSAGRLNQACTEAVLKNMGFQPERKTNGGTSDGRFLVELGAEVVELGLKNSSAHALNEHCAIEELYCLTKIYRSVLDNLGGEVYSLRI